MTSLNNLDVPYFKGKLELILRDINYYTPAELSRELARLSNTATYYIKEKYESSH